MCCLLLFVEDKNVILRNSGHDMMLFKLLLYLAMREETSSHPPVYVLQK
jgi:hypothetical protein